MRAQQQKARFFGGFFGLSLLLHLQVVLLLVIFVGRGCGNYSSSGIKPLAVSVVPVEVVSPPKPPVKKKVEKKQQKKKPEETLKGQVVDIRPPDQERRPDKARFLSEYDSKVRKETKARQASKRAGVLRASRPLPIQPKRASAKERKRLVRKIMKLAMRAQRAQPRIPKASVPRAEKGDVAQPKPQPRKRQQIKVTGAKKRPRKGHKASQRKVSLKDLKLTKDELSKLVGGSRVKDALKDVAEGKATLLNSKRWRFASFFNRVKRQVAQNWHPNRVYRRRDPSGNIYGFKDRLTVLRVKLTPSGKLQGVHLEKASGVAFLDDEAIRAFRLAQPFPNPPRALIDQKTGVISFRFGFLFEISRRPSFKIFRFR
jgi:TonB family protein